jgi:Domain of unknown function (DUF4214)
MQSTPSTLDELLARHDRHFVHSAYLMLLNRTPDPDGLSFYLGQLRTGSSKIRILAQLRQSKEGIAQAVKIPELDVALKLYKREQRPLIGWFFRILHGGEGNRSTERKLRMIENQLGILTDESNQRLTQIETTLISLNQLAQQQTGSVTSLGSSTFVAINDISSINSFQSNVLDRLKQLPPRVRDIYFHITSAAARNAGGTV